MDIQKEFDRWWNTFKNQATRQYPVKAAREAWAACAMLMADRVKELEIAYQKTGSSNLDLSESLMFADEAIDLYKKDVSDLQAEVEKLKDNIMKGSDVILDLQSKLYEAVEIIKTISKNANHYDKIDLQNKAEQFLPILDKTIKDKKQIITKLPIFVKEPVGAIEWFNREKINELVDVVNKHFEPRMSKLDGQDLIDKAKLDMEVFRSDLEYTNKRLDKLEKHKHKSFKGKSDFEPYGTETSEPISDKPESHLDKGIKWVGQMEENRDMKAVIKVVYEIARAYSSDDGKAATNRIVDKLKPFVEK